MAQQTKLKGRQWPLSASVNAGIAQIGTGNEVVFAIPPGSYLYAIDFTVVTPFDGTTTVTGNLSDGTTNLIAAQSLKTAGAVTAAVTKGFYPNGATFTFSIADASGNSANGQVIGFARYENIYRANEAQE